MGKQSTRHRYRNRREKNREVARTAKIVGGGLLILLLFLIIRNWEDWWAYYKTYFY